MNLSNEELLEMAQYSFIRMDGAYRGLFGKDMGVSVEHTKNLNRGDDCCEVVVKKIKATVDG